MSFGPFFGPFCDFLAVSRRQESTKCWGKQSEVLGGKCGVVGKRVWFWGKVRVAVEPLCADRLPDRRQRPVAGEV